MLPNLLKTPLYAAGDSPAAAPAEETPKPDAPDPIPENPETLKTALLKAVEERSRRAQNSVLRSMAEQKGVPEETLGTMLTEARAEQAPEVPPDVQKHLDTVAAAAERKLKMAEVKTVGAEMGLLDAEVALELIGPDTLAVTDDGEVTGAREALESLKKRKGYLFAQPVRAAWAQKVSAGNAPPVSGVEEAFYRKNPTLRR